MKFNKEDWAAYSIDNDDRESMLTDLTKHYKLKGSSYRALTDLLGKPQFTDSAQLFYEIHVDYDVIDPSGGENLIFYLN